MKCLCMGCAGSHVYGCTVAMVFAYGTYVYLCSFDVEVCLTVERTGVDGNAFVGPSVGESAMYAKSVCGLCSSQLSLLPAHYPRTVDMNYTLELEAELAAMGLPQRSFFQNSTSDTTLEQSVTVPNDNTTLCQNHTVLIRKAVINRESAFTVSLKAQGQPQFVPITDGNKSISDLLARPTIISPDTKLRSVSASKCD